MSERVSIAPARQAAQPLSFEAAASTDGTSKQKALNIPQTSVQDKKDSSTTGGWGFSAQAEQSGLVFGLPDTNIHSTVYGHTEGLPDVCISLVNRTESLRTENAMQIASRKIKRYIESKRLR